MSQQQLLYQLQKIDSELDARRSRVREINAALKADDALRQAEAAVSSLEEELTPQQARVKDLNLEIQSVSNQASQLSVRLYSGKVTNPKELQDIQDKIAERKRRHASLENSLLESMIAVEELQESLADASGQLEHIKSGWEAEQEALTKERHRLRREIKALKTERETIAQDINADNLALYESLREKRQGVAVAVLQGDSCSGCGVTQTTMVVQRIRQGNELVQCASCGRILIAL